MSSAALVVVILARRRVRALRHATGAACTAFGMLVMVFVPLELSLRLGDASHPLLHVARRPF